LVNAWRTASWLRAINASDQFDAIHCTPAGAQPVAFLRLSTTYGRFSAIFNLSVAETGYWESVVRACSGLVRLLVVSQGYQT